MISPTGNNIPSTSKQLKMSIEKLMLETTFHAIPNIARTENKFVKLMWALCLAVSTSVGVYFVYNNIIEYLEFKVITNFEIIHERRSEFPTVSLCSMTGFQNDSLDDIIKECSFSADNECGENKSNAFETFYDIAYGKCFRFNSGKLKSAYTSIFNGLRYGLNINISVPINSILIININNKSSIPFSVLNRETFIAAGSKNFYSVKRLFTQNLPEPYNNCFKNVSDFSFNKTFINMILNAKRTYSQPVCIDLCLYSYYLENSQCGCNSTIENVQVLCALKADLKLKNCTIHFQNKNLEKGAQFCANYCPLECDSIDYSIDKYSFNSMNANLASVTVYYETLKYTLISQQPKILLIDLIPSIGGTIGLFVGTSFLSFIEIFELFIETFCIVTKRYHLKS